MTFDEAAQQVIVSCDPETKIAFSILALAIAVKETKIVEEDF